MTWSSFNVDWTIFGDNTRIQGTSIAVSDKIRISQCTLSWEKKFASTLFSRKFANLRSSWKFKISILYELSIDLCVFWSARVCHVLEFVKLLKSHCNQCKFGFFSKWCISFGQQCMVLNPGIYKVHLSTLFTKRNTTFHAAFILILSLYIPRQEFFVRVSKHHVHEIDFEFTFSDILSWRSGKFFPLLPDLTEWTTL